MNSVGEGEAKPFLSSNDEGLEEYDAQFETMAPISAVTNGPEGEFLLSNGRGRIVYVKNFLTEKEADELMSNVRNARSFRRSAIEFGKGKMLQPRDTAFFGTKLYSYGGETRQPTDWEDDVPASTAVHALGKRIETYLNLPENWFDLVLVNRYRDGRDFMEWHSDNERNLGDEPIIASVSIGAERHFLVRPRKDGMAGKPVDIIRYTLAHGSLLVMSGKMQRFYQHAVPRVEIDECQLVRLNFTFRRIIDENDFSVHPTEG